MNENEAWPMSFRTLEELEPEYAHKYPLARSSSSTARYAGRPAHRRVVGAHL
jgi:hypothetical protein